MIKQKGSAVFGLIILIVIVFGFGAWVINVVKLLNCDFESDYKCEFVHGVGLIVAPTSVVTVWFDSDES